jgi:adenylate kinase
MSVIFLAGVHGVGKGFLGVPVAKAIGITHLTASQLIRDEKGKATWGINKETSELDDNQLALIRAVNQRRVGNTSILLDGHFVLRNASGVLTPLATTVFKELRLAGVVLLTEEASVIANRLTARDGRDDDWRAVSRLAEAELAHARKVCSELGLPFTVIQTPTQTTLNDAIEQLLKVKSCLDHE